MAGTLTEGASATRIRAYDMEAAAFLRLAAISPAGKGRHCQGDQAGGLVGRPRRRGRDGAMNTANAVADARKG